MKLRFSTFVPLLSVVAMTFIGTGCQEDKFQEEDVNDFTLTYGELSITPTKESNGKRLASPEWTGKAPSAFEIINMTYEGKTFSAGDFVEVVRDNGAIKILNAVGRQIGTYKIYVACQSGGQRFESGEATIKVLAPVSDAVTVTPSELGFDVSEIGAPDKVTSAVLTPAEGRNLESVKIANVYRYSKDSDEPEAGNNNSLFQVENNKVSPVNVAGFPGGKYVIDLEVEVDGESGLLENALTVNISAKPIAVFYSEVLSGWQLSASETSKTFVSVAPVLTGDKEGAVYEINGIEAPEGVTPAEGMFTVDSETGVITLTTTPDTDPGDYKVTFKVKNIWIDEAVVVEGGLNVNIAAPAHTIDNFSYDSANRIYLTATEDKKFSTKVMDGEQVAFSLVDVPSPLQNKLEIDSTTGDITVKGGAAGLKPGLYATKVLAENNTTPGGKMTVFYFTVCEEGKFTFFSYGNNFEDLDASIAAGTTSQFRCADNNTYRYPVKFSDIPEGETVTWSVAVPQFGGNTADKLAVPTVTVENTGGLELSINFQSESQISFVLVTATLSGGASLTQPVFFNRPMLISENGISEITVEYTPFVVRFNPNALGQIKSAAPKASLQKGEYAIDFRGDFCYYNLNGEADGEKLASGKLANDNNDFDNPLKYLWVNAPSPAINKAANNGGGVNFGSRQSISLTSVPGNLIEQQKLGAATYISPDDYSVIVNPSKWKITPFTDLKPGKSAVSYSNEKTGVLDGVFWCRSSHESNRDKNRAVTTILWSDQNYIPVNQH